MRTVLFGRALAKKQAELEKQLTGLRNSVALVSQESKSGLEGAFRETRNLHESLRALDGSVKAQMTVVNEVTSAIGKSSNLEAINLLEMIQSFNDRLNHLEEAINHTTSTTIIEQAEVFNAPVGIPSEATLGTSATPKSSRRGKGRRRRKDGGEYSTQGSGSPVEA